MLGNKVLDKREEIVGVMEALSFADMIRDLEKCVQRQIMKVTRVMPLNLVDTCVVVSEYAEMVNVHTKYKLVDKDVKAAAVPLPTNSLCYLRSSHYVFQRYDLFP
jgi:hypothetical protein